jgi:LCP family protein required for cell wall assembly
MSLLISGVASEGYMYGLADAVRVVRVDFQTQSVSILSLPRDMWVRIPGIADHGVREGKLNQAYFYGTQGMGYYDGSGYGSGLLALTLQENFGLQVDHYVAVNLYAFRDIVDAMGGVDVYLPSPVYIKRYGEPKLYKKAGYRHLSGKEAEKVVRARIGIGDFGRIQNQTVVLKAVAAKMLSPANVKHLPTIVKSLIQETQTDLSPSEISKLICLAEKVDPDKDISFQEIPQPLMKGAWIRDDHLGYIAYALTYDPQEIQRFMADFEDGEG